jgi:hypothetical protein
MSFSAYIARGTTDNPEERRPPDRDQWIDLLSHLPDFAVDSEGGATHLRGETGYLHYSEHGVSVEGPSDETWATLYRLSVLLECRVDWDR